MCKRLLCMSIGLLLMTSTGFAQVPGLIGHWALDETEGLTAVDSSGNGNDGDLTGELEWRPDAGVFGGGLWYSSDDINATLRIPTTGMSATEGTFMVWGNLAEPYPTNRNDSSYFFGHTTWPAFGNRLQLYMNTADTILDLGLGASHTLRTDILELETAIWYHVALTWDRGNYVVYVNGDAVDSGTYTDLTTLNAIMDIGNDGDETNTEAFAGVLDDARSYNRALSQNEIILVMLGRVELAGDPNPASGASEVLRDVSLSWTPGKYALKHDVYLGTSFEDVNTAEPGALVSQGQTDAEYIPDSALDFGQTYFWRVDEVNGAPDNTVFKGEVWTFTTELFSYPILNITATASGSHDNNMGPEKTIDGSGLDELDQHSTTATDMWLSPAGTAPWIQYEFDKTYKLHEMLIWNSNQLVESFIGLGAKDVTVEHSTDGSDWVQLEGDIQFAQATGTTDYTANTIIDFAGVQARYARITISAGWGMMPQYGLSEVRFHHIPTFAREPQPEDGGLVDGANAILAWRSGREAVSHQVYLGTDASDLALLGTTTDTTYAVDALNYATPYYWSVTEVNDAEAIPSYAGDVWSFTTPDFGTVDDFDQYDDKCNRIFFAWEDGLGHSGAEDIDDCDVPASNGNGGGSIVGNDQAPFAEKTIVNTGSTQSLPFNYDNSFGASEASLSIPGQDWSASSVQTLALAFHGAAGNTGTLYVKINNSKIVYDGDAADISGEAWQLWNIDLSSVSGLQNVTSLTIGVDGANAAGMLYFDDIRLYP